MTEDDRHFFPWLEIVEHLVVVDALNPKAHSNHARACKELVTALDHVYAVRDGGDKVPGARNLSSLFAGAWGSFIGTGGLESRTNMPPTLLQSKRRLAKGGPPVAASTGYAVPSTSSISTVSSSRSSQQSQQSQQSLASLDFSQVRTGVASLFSTPSSTQGVAIEIFLEQDAALSKTQTNASFSKARKCYIQESFAGLMHAPFSLLVYSAPILLPGSLKQVAWDTILDRNQELAQAAGCFFLLAAAKEGESVMKDFFSKSVVKASAAQQREAVLRFMALWRFRYKVWPAVGEKGQKKFNAERGREEREDQQTIGYSLPANLLGSDGRDVPVAPWTALSICVHHDCQTNPDKCYRATRLAPLKHCKEVSESVESFSVSGISLPLEADSKPTSVFAGVGSEDNAGNININQWEAIEPTLFPPSLLPLINFVITSLTPHSLHTFTSTQTSRSSFNQQSLSKSELAYQAVKQCMVEDPRLLFRPLLNGFNKLYQEISDKKSQLPHTVFSKSLKDTLHPLHSILQSFSFLPPKAAHFLFNNFVGIITRHTDQPCASSAVIVQSVLVLLTMVIPSVQGLDLKALKSVLKKESCYTTILTTARIRGAEKIQIIDETFSASTRSSSGIAVVQGVDPDDTFGHIIARVKGVQLSYDLLQNLYLVDQSKDLPVLSTLVVKDHYSMLSDRQYPTFALREAGRGHGREAWSWGDQLNQLFVHKMSEALRVLMSVRLLSTGPDVERGSNDIYNKFAQPNYRFLHQELVALNSFPRQALTSILYEAGSATLTQHHMRSSDSMLIGTWVKFILDFFIRVKTDYDWANSMALFLNVVNGALLLYSEDSAILRQGVASLVIAASKFVHVFRKNGYEMVVPTIVQVYASHINNKLITDTLKFIWGKFYLLNLDSNVFLLQAIAATATLLSEEAAKLSTTSGTSLPTFLHSQQTVVAQHNHARAVFQLMKSLESETAPPDHLHVMGCCPAEQEPESPWQPLTLQTTFYLCITLASWNPEAVRGMQVLVFLDHLIPMFLKEISSRVPSTSLDAMRLLVKGCDAITKPQSWKGDFLSRRETQRTDTQQNLDMVGESMATTREPRLHPPERKPSKVAKIYRRIVNPSKGMDTMEGSGYFSQTNLDKAVSTLPPIGHQEYVGEFKRRVQATNQRVLQLSRVSLLSLASKFVSHESTQMRERSDQAPRTTAIRMDAQTTVYLTTIAVQLLKLGGTNEVTLTSQGLCCFMESLLPNIEWSDAHLNSFHSVISRLVKLFRTLCRVRIILAWDSLGLFLRGITECIRNSPQLAAHEPNFTKLKTLLEVIVNAPSQGGGGGGGGGQEGSPSQNRGGQRRPLLHFAPNAFNDVVVGLISQLIVTTKNTHNPRLRYRLSDLLSQKLSTKDALLPKILLPLCIHLGLREDLEQLPQEDLDFLLQLLDKKVENTLKLSRPPLHPSHFLDASRSDIPADMFFRAIKVFSCAFSGSFTLQDWSRVSQWVMSLSLRKLEGPGGRLDLTGGSTSSLAISSRRSSRHSSVSSVTGQHNVDSYLAFYKALLVHVYESLLSVYRIPLFSFLWPILGQLEAQLSEAEKCVKIENPAQLQGIRSCIEKCQKLRRQSQHLHTTKSKNSLLVSYQEEMRTQVQHQFKRSSTTVDRKRPRHALKKRLSYQLSLPSIGEEDPKGKGKDSRDGASRKGSKAIDSRPTFLKFSSPPPQQETRAKKAAVVLKEEDVKKKTRFSHDETASKTGTSYSSSDAATPKPPTAQPVQSSLQKKSAMRKYPTDQGKLSPLSSPPAVSPRVKRKPRKTVSNAPRSPLTKPAKRHPPLGELRNDSKFTSSEFQADVEDFDAISPLSIHDDDDDDGNNRVRDIELETSTTATSRAGFESESTTDRAVLERERDESTTHGPYTVTLQAEVHFDSLLPESSAPTSPVHLLSPSAHSPSLIPPPPLSSRPSSRSASYSPVPSSTCSPLPSPSLPSPLPHLPPPTPTSTTDTYSQDLDCSIDMLLPRNRTGSSPPPSLRDNSSHGETSPYNTETDTETLLPHPSSSRSSGSRKDSSSPTTRKKLSFDRRQGSSKDSSSGTYYINMPGLGRESDC